MTRFFTSVVVLMNELMPTLLLVPPGLHTKVCQVAAQAFGVPLDDVYVNDTSTDKVANTIPTAASMSTDTYGMATLDACRQILVRLEPIREKLGPDAPLRDVAKTRTHGKN